MRTNDRRGARRPMLGCVGGTVLCGLVLSATVATAAKPKIISGNLVRNGGGEVGGAARDAGHTVKPAGWKTTLGFTAVQYGVGGGFPETAASKAIGGGKHFFAGGAESNRVPSTATQVVSVPAAFRKAGVTATATLSAALGGYSSQLDSASVTATFLSTTGAKLGALTVGPVSAGRRGGATKLVPVAKKTRLPTGTISIEIVITARPLSGGYNDGYADNVDLRLSA